MRTVAGLATVAAAVLVVAGSASGAGRDTARLIVKVSGYGSVSASAFDCVANYSHSCSKSLAVGKRVKFVATGDGGNRFFEWEDDCAAKVGTAHLQNPDCAVTIKAPKTVVTAVFVQTGGIHFSTTTTWKRPP